MNLDNLTNAQKDKIINDATSFLIDFNLVFKIDWDLTKDIIKADNLNWYISETGNFIEPDVDNEGNNWGNRGCLLSSYRKLLQTLKMCGDEFATNESELA